MSIFLLVPLAFSVIWSIFMLSSNLVTSLVALLFSSLALPMMYMEHMKLFWPCGLLLILMSTGLIVVFAYIVSLHSKESKTISSKVQFMGLLISMMIILKLTLNPTHFSVFNSATKDPFVDPIASLVLISLLLFLVVSFIRVVYSKGGGFRKKF